MLDKKYNYLEKEEKWQNYWFDNDIYKYDLDSPKATYSIDTPPPTCNGKIHMGHLSSYMHIETIARHHRMKGENVYFPFGFDDNGLPTERYVEKIIKKRAYEHKNTLMVGRSHGIHGEPITFGLVLAIWHDEIKRAYELLNHAKSVISTGMISGAMGNFAHSPLELEELVCQNLGLNPAPASNQVIQRDRYAQVISALAILASSCEKIAVAIRHYQRTEVYEAEEYFSPGQKGSSAMPHKRNPVLSENVTGLCRMIRSYAIPAMENVALWHERDISHSSVERFILPDAFITSDFMLNRLNGILANLVVYPENMMKNLNLTGGLVFSQRVLLELPKQGVSREDAYKIVQRNAMKVWADLQEGKKALNENGESLFLQNLLNDNELREKLNENAIKECFDYTYYTKNVDRIFKRVFEI